jgi:two-component system response regulator RegA
VTESPRLLLVEDDRGFRETLALEFGERGYEVREADTLAQVSEILDGSPGREGFLPRFAVVDLRLRGEDGLPVVEAIHRAAPEARVVILTGYGSLPSAVRAMKVGAANYLSKPVGIAKLERALWTDEADPQELAAPAGPQSLATHEREYIEYVLLQCEGNISKAARWLGLHRQSLQRKLRKFT